jgi:PcfJ-like protein
MTTTKVVDLLRDGRGIYGIGVAIDRRELAIACGRDTWGPPDLILRSDMLAVPKPPDLFKAALQKITGGFRHGMFSHCIEEHLRKLIHYRMLHTAGLPWPPDGPLSPVRYWSTDAKQQARNRKIYHGLRRGSLAIINKLIGAATEAAAEPDALKVARRFPFDDRYRVYCAAARSTRARQLCETFPALACEIYCDGRVVGLKPDVDEDHVRSFENFVVHEEARARQRAEAIKLVERGARLRDIAALMGLPMALRRVKPGAVRCISRQSIELLAYMPDSLPQMRFWLRVVGRVGYVSGDFAEWATKNAMQIPGGSVNERFSLLSDLADWVRASHNVDRFVVRPFSPDMSLRTVTKLSADWHEAIANSMDGPQYSFPQPWLPATRLNGYEIVPITNSAELYREGDAMHNCVGTYAGDVMVGKSYIYSVREDDKRMATVQVVRAGDRPALAQIRGPCNAPAPKEIVAAVRRWLAPRRPRRPRPENDDGVTARSNRR